MSEYSVHAIHQADPPRWLPGEDNAASAFLAMVILLVLEINFQIHRVFKHRRGVYFWAMQLGSLGCAVDVVGVLMKNLIPSARPVWPLYTLMATTGWAVYTVAQLTVLYSRLHLVLDSPNTQRFVLYVIAFASPILIIVDWVVIWPAYNPATSADWSVEVAIVERIMQFGFSAIEVMINIIYTVSILNLLKPKSSVRQRRVMLDLIYVNILAVAFDILNIVLVYVNRVGISHPIQVFGYALKLRLEFIVLNQLMAVAARGFRRPTWEETRYHKPSNASTNWDWDIRKFCRKSEAAVKVAERSPSDATSSSEYRNSIPAPIFLTPFRLPRDPNPLSPKPTTTERKQSMLRTTLGKFLYKGSKLRKKKLVVDKAKNRLSALTYNDKDEPEDEEIGLHEWERQASRTLEVPWLSTTPSDGGSSV